MEKSLCCNADMDKNICMSCGEDGRIECHLCGDTGVISQVFEDEVLERKCTCRMLDFSGATEGDR